MHTTPLNNKAWPYQCSTENKATRCLSDRTQDISAPLAQLLFKHIGPLITNGFKQMDLYMNRLHEPNPDLCCSNPETLAVPELSWLSVKALVISL